MAFGPLPSHIHTLPSGGGYVALDEPEHPLVTPEDTLHIARTYDARFREAGLTNDAYAAVLTKLQQIEKLGGMAPGDVSDATVAGLIRDPASDTQQALDEEIYSRIQEADEAYRPELWREPGDVDDTASLQRCLDAADGRPIRLTSGKTYQVSKQLYTAGKDVCLLSDGAVPATILTSVDSTVLLIVGHNPSATTTVSGGVSIGSRFWPVPSGTAFRPGMLLTVKSDKLWYHDPRDLAKKSELGMVWGIGATEIRTVDGANDGYPASETVTVTGAEPIRVRIEGVRISGTDVEGQARRGIHIQGAAFPLLRGVEVVDCPTMGIFFDRCYGPRVENARVSGFNAVTTGYGVQAYGCRHTRVVHSTFWGGRRAVDFSGGEVISIDSKVIDCQALGGGYQYGGGPYGWAGNNGSGAANYGFGSHGPSDGAEYVRCYTQGIQYPYSLRGANERVTGCSHFGPTSGGVITLTYGRNLHVSGVRVYALQDGGDKDISLAQGGANINARRADSLIAVYGGYDHAGSTVVITDTYAELEDAAIRFEPGTVFGGVVHMSGCSFRFATPSGGTPAAVFKHSGALASIGGRWRVGPVGYSRVGGTGGVTLTSGVNMEGAQVVNYAASGPTT